MDLYAELCAKPDVAESIEAELDAVIADYADERDHELGLVPTLEAKMKVLHASAAIVLLPAYELVDQAHLNRAYLHPPAAAIAKHCHAPNLCSGGC